MGFLFYSLFVLAYDISLIILYNLWDFSYEKNIQIDCIVYIGIFIQIVFEFKRGEYSFQ